MALQMRDRFQGRASISPSHKAINGMSTTVSRRPRDASTSSYTYLDKSRNVESEEDYTPRTFRTAADTKKDTEIHMDKDEDARMQGRSHWDAMSQEEKDKNDRRAIAWLLILYTLQGIPMGLQASIPFLLQERIKDYRVQAAFSLVTWPFSVKLLWAPIVDGLYSSRIGRRKTWLVPIQLLVGLLMFVSSFWIDELLGAVPPSGAGGGGDGSEDGQAALGTVHIAGLTVIFFVMYFLCATQDIAVDGWALTMLSPSSVQWGSLCNSIGQSLGYFTAFVLFLALNDAETCNTYLRSTPSDRPLVELSDFFWFWGIVFIVVTICVALFKSERPPAAHSREVGIVVMYRRLWQVVCLPSVRRLAMVLLTTRIAFAGVDAATGLKLQEYGVPKDKLAFMGPILFPVYLAVPSILGHIKTPPLKLFVNAYPVRLLLGLFGPILVYYAETTINGREEPLTALEYGVIFVVTAISMVMASTMFTSQMQFFCKLSDPLIGGSYMTLLNTLANLGSNWPSSLSLAVIGSLETCKDGSSPKDGTCEKNFNAYYVVALTCLAFGWLWWLTTRRFILRLESLPASAWLISSGLGKDATA